MLQKIHDQMTGWVAYLILGGVAGVFVLWGINWTMRTPDYAAKVNGTEIPANQVRDAYQRRLAALDRQANGNVDDAARAALKKKVLDQFVAEEAMITRVHALGYRVSSADVLAAESQIPAFQVGGKFDPAHAIALLQANGQSIDQVEAMIRRQIQLNQFADALNLSAFATPAEVDRVEALLHEQREIGWIEIPSAPYAASATPTDPQVQAYYQAHPSQYMTPETVDLSYIELSLAKLAAAVPVGDAQLRAYYEEQKAKNPQDFVQPEERRVSHILIAVSNPKDDAAAKAKAEKIYRLAVGGANFAALARQYSQDPGSASQGGDLGWNDRKAWVKPFADAAFSMKVGQIVGPVKTQFGYHIIKLVGIKPASVKTFEQSQAQLATEYRRAQADKEFNHLEDKLADAALQNPTDIAAAARKTGLPVQTIPGFTRQNGGGPFLHVQPVIDAAFSADVLDGNLSSLVQVSKDDAIVVLSTNHQLPRLKPLAAVHDAVVAAWQQQRGTALALAAAQAAEKSLAAGQTWAQVAKSLKLTAQPPRFVSREEPSVPIEIRRDAFDAPKPKLAPIYRAIALHDGNAAVFGVDAVRQDPAATGADKPLIARELAAAYAGEEAQAYATAARAHAKVVLNPKAID